MKTFNILLTFLFLSIASLFAKDSILERKKITFIINPISGGINKDSIVKKISKTFNSKKYDIEIIYTQGPKHATELAKFALKKGSQTIAVVGGDGTINEVSQALINTNVALAIIPTGSGNGFARHLHIPFKINKALKIIKKEKIETIDTVKINNRFYLGVAGIGFDAEVGWAFAEFGHRGFFPYLLLTLQELPKYSPQSYSLEIDGKKIEREAFLISFANSSQFGNGACIAPTAVINDGSLDLIIMKKFPSYQTLKMVSHLFNRTLHHCKYVEMLKCREVIVKNKNLKAHIDGEPLFFEKEIHIQINPSSLKIIIP